jgi:Glycosyl transferase family 2.
LHASLYSSSRLSPSNNMNVSNRKQMRPTPITLFTYNRPWHTRMTIEALLNNDLASESELLIFSDGPRKSQDRQKIDEVRQYVRTVKGFRNVTLVERSQNLGLGQSIINGVSEVLKEHERIIVLEDDLVTSPFFLQYMNEALELYKDVEKVISVHGYIFPVAEKLPSTFFLRGADCLGWGTWKRGWALFEENGQKLLDDLKKRHLTRQFDFNGAYRYTRMLKDQINGRNTSWAVRWYASAFLNNLLTLYPGVSLVQHIGNDGTGTNFGVSDFLDVELTQAPLQVTAIEPIENVEARRVVVGYLRTIKIPLYKAAINRAKKYMIKTRNST